MIEKTYKMGGYDFCTCTLYHNGHLNHYPW